MICPNCKNEKDPIGKTGLLEPDAIRELDREEIGEYIYQVFGCHKCWATFRTEDNAGYQEVKIIGVTNHPMPQP